MTPDLGGPDVFVHVRALTDCQALVQGASVTFMATQEPNTGKYRAKSCAASGGGLPAPAPGVPDSAGAVLPTDRMLTGKVKVRHVRSSVANLGATQSFVELSCFTFLPFSHSLLLSSPLGQEGLGEATWPGFQCCSVVVALRNAWNVSDVSPEDLNLLLAAIDHA